MSTSIGSAELDIIPNTAGFQRQLSRGLRTGGAVLGIGALGAGIGGLIKNSVSLQASFSKTMAQVGASTDGATAHMAELNALAKKLGADTTFSANEASGAMLELGKSGISAADIMGGALQGTLLLAAAGSTDLGTAATIASNAMNAFNLRGKDMNQIAAALAGGANASSASVESLGQALSQVGPGAVNAGLSLQETVGVLSAFDAAGIKGSDAGTSLKTALSRLVPQTDAASSAMRKYNLDFTDAKGNFVSITNVADQLRKGLGGLSEAERVKALTTIFGSDATRAATVLMKQGAKGIGTYIEATKDQNAAQKLAKANMSGTAGAMERLQGAVETAELQLGEALAPTILKVANFLSDEAVPAVTGFIKGMQDGTGAGGELAHTVGEVVDVGKGIVKVFDDLPGPVKKFGVELALALVVMRSVGPTMAAARLSMTNFASGVRTAETRMATLRGATTALSGAGGMVLLAASTQTANQSLKFMEKAAAGALIGLSVGGPLGAAVGGVAGAVIGLATATHSSAVEMVDAKGAADRYAESLRGVLDASSAGARKTAIDVLKTNTTANTPAAQAAIKQLGISQRDLVNIITGEAGARSRVAAIARRASKSSYEGVRTNAAVIRDLLLPALDGQRHKLKDQITTNREYNHEVETLKNLVKQLPPKAQTDVAALHGKATIADVKDLNRRYHLTPKQVQTVIEATDVDATVAQIQGVSNRLNNLDGKTAHVSVLATLLGVTAPAAAGQGRGVLRPEQGGGSARAGGGPVVANRPYIVGERHPELFIPSTNGRIEASIPTANAAGVGGGSLGRLTITNWTEGTGYFEVVSDDRVGAHAGSAGMIRRAR